MVIGPGRNACGSCGVLSRVQPRFRVKPHTGFSPTSSIMQTLLRERWRSFYPAIAPLCHEYVLVAFLSALTGVAMFTFRLGTMPLTSPNEGLYGLVAREMIERHDFVTPHINGAVYFEKPPLLYWLNALCMSVFGETAFAARLPSALAGIATSILVYGLGSKMYGRTAAGYAATVVATGIGFVLMARQVMFDALLTCFVTGALVAFWYCDPDESKAASDAAIYLFYAATALAVLTKGLLGVLIPLIVVISYGLVAQDWSRPRRLRHARGIATFLAIVVPWHILVSLRHPEFVWFYFVNEHLMRFLGRREPADFHIDPIYTPLLALFVLTVPWCIFLPAALRQALQRLRKTAEQRRKSAFLLCWLATPTLLFTLSGSRTLYYLLPVVPPLALLIGSMWDEVMHRWSDRSRHRWLFLPLLGCYAAVFIYWLVCDTKMHSDAPSYWRYEIAFSSLIWLLAGMAVCLVALRRNAAAAFASLALATLFSGVTALDSWSHWQNMSTEANLAALVEAQGARDRGKPVVVMDGRFEDHSSFAFYLPPALRPVYVYNGRWGGDLQFGGGFPEVNHLFINLTGLKRLAAHHQVYVVSDKDPMAPMPGLFHVVRDDGHAVLWSNGAGRGI